MDVKIRKGDQVEVISGRLEDRKKRGEVIRVNPDEGTVVVQGVNLRTKHQRQVQQSNNRTMAPGKVRFEAPLHISNVMLVCPKCSKPSRISLSRENGKTLRVCKKCQAVIDAA
jgi:large subunit ribosomal protein L24